MFPMPLPAVLFISALAIALTSLMFSAPAEAELRPLPEPENPRLPSLILIGDSTVRNGWGDGGNGQWGWGEPLAELFNERRINVVNRAVGGLSSRTYLTAGYWPATRDFIKTGDIVLIQFGHNDSGPLNDDSRARGTVRGNGDQSEQIVNQLTGQPEEVHSYGWYIRLYIKETQERGGLPIVCSPVPRKSWNEQGKINRSGGSYGGWAREAAEQMNVPFLDLNALIADEYDQLGKERVEPLFADRHTHTSRQGAELNAACVAAGLRTLLGKDIERSLKPKAADQITSASVDRVTDYREH